MELSERYIKKFEAEDYPSVYEWQDPAGTIYEPHSHKGKVSLFVTDGSITFDFGDYKKEVKGETPPTHRAQANTDISDEDAIYWNQIFKS